MSSPRFARIDVPAGALALRDEARAFLRSHPLSMPAEQRAWSWTGFDASFTRALGQAGLIGITFPTEFGGRGLSALERHLVLEELLVAGAPVAAHWMADRQSGPLLLRHGREPLRSELLHAITRGDAHFCIGMSEPGAGSDLAAVRTSAVPVRGGYRLNGTKLWGTHVTRCRWMIALVRTAPDAPRRHQGLSQLVIDLTGPGIEVRPVLDLLGHSHFGEVVFEDAFVPAGNLLGTEGDGWRQVMEELAYERSGPERVLSSYVLLEAWVAHAVETDQPHLEAVLGRLLARLRILREMSLSVADRLSRGEDVGVDAALVKDLGTRFEQSIPEQVARHAPDAVPMRQGGEELMRVHGTLFPLSTSFALRGGSREILRDIVARELLK